MKKVKNILYFTSFSLLVGLLGKTTVARAETITCYLISTNICHTVIVHDPFLGPISFPTYGIKAPQTNIE